MLGGWWRMNTNPGAWSILDLLCFDSFSHFATSCLSSLLEASKHGNGTAVKHNNSYMPYYVYGSNLPRICRYHSFRFVQTISHHKMQQTCNLACRWLRTWTNSANSNSKLFTMFSRKFWWTSAIVKVKPFNNYSKHPSWKGHDVATAKKHPKTDLKPVRKEVTKQDTRWIQKNLLWTPTCPSSCGVWGQEAQFEGSKSPRW